MKIKPFLGLISMALCFGAVAKSAVAKPTVVKNIQGYTLVSGSAVTQPKWHSFSTLVFDNGKVVATGDATLAAKYNDSRIIDGKNQYLLPGMTDAHGHILSLGFGKLSIDVRGLASAGDTVQAVQAYAKKHPQLSWIKGRGWNQELWASRQYPQAKDLDEYLNDRPVWLKRVDGHAGWANQKALAFAGITKDTLDPDGGAIIRDAAGEPTGILIDNAMDLLENKMPKPTVAETQVALDLAMDHLLSLGITSVHDAGIKHSTYDLYKYNAKNNKLNLRIYGMVDALTPKLFQVLEQGHIKDSKDMLSIRSVKLSVDGALGSRGAALLKPYSDKPGATGLMLVSQPQMSLIFEQVLKHNFQLNVHAIGDKGNQLVLDHFEHAYKGQSNGRLLRNRIEHAQVVALSDIPRFKTLNIMPSMQQTHATSDMNMAKDRVGAQRLKGAYAWQTFLKQGSRIAGGSDFPVELANPFFGLHAAVTRQNRENQPKSGWIPQEAMTTAQALTSFTLDAAYAAHQDDVLGSLEKGKWADFILVDKDVFNAPANELWQTKVLQTWVGGELKYKAQ
ncbi:MAG: amidohydrolase [Algicola sp.]|nr:amidohydrolase [Algicola sp.]